MTGFVLLLISGLYLLSIQKLARSGMNKQALTMSEAFVIGHWPFLFLNGVLLWLYGGVDWTSI